MKEETSNTEQSILKAAEKEFLKKGFSGSKTTEIAKEAGVTHAMLHYYFCLLYTSPNPRDCS